MRRLIARFYKKRSFEDAWKGLDIAPGSPKIAQNAMLGKLIITKSKSLTFFKDKSFQNETIWRETPSKH